MTLHTLEARGSFHGRLFLAFSLLVALGSLVTLPLLWSELAAQISEVSYLLPIVTVATGLQIVLVGGLAMLGLRLAHRIGLGAPILEGWSRGESVARRVKSMLLPAILCGVVSVPVIFGLEAFVFAPHMQQAAGAEAMPTGWQGFLVAINAGITEEIVFRLFLLSFVAWLGCKLSKTAEGRPSTVVFWAANLFAALLFGAAHLPTAAALGMSLGVWAVAGTVTLNALLGLMFGVLYRRYGIESAIVAHASFDVVVYGILPLVFVC